MTKLSIAFLAALSLVGFGCHKDKAKDKANAGEAIARLAELKTKMCACPDKACSEKVSAELTDWDQAQQKAAGDKPALREEDEKKIEDLKEELSQCLLKLEFPRGSGAAGSGGAAGAAGSAAGSGGTAGSGGPAAGAAEGSAAGAAPAGGAAGGSAAGPAGGGSAH